MILSERDKNRIEIIEEHLLNHDECPSWALENIQYLLGLVGGLEAALRSHAPPPVRVVREED